jgi:RES domain-containing protein
MRAVRLCTRQHPGLDGTGSQLFGSRWNSPGRAVVYAASCGALAVLEYIVHLSDLPANLLLVGIEIPQTLPFEEIHSIPADPKAFRQLGDEWLQHNGTAVLRVPSVLVPRQWNVLINPAHPLFASIKIVDQSPFAFDSRLLSSLPSSSASEGEYVPA